jgi:hypothetical protein
VTKKPVLKEDDVNTGACSIMYVFGARAHLLASVWASAAAAAWWWCRAAAAAASCLWRHASHAERREYIGGVDQRVLIVCVYMGAHEAMMEQSKQGIGGGWEKEGRKEGKGETGFYSGENRLEKLKYKVFRKSALTNSTFTFLIGLAACAWNSSVIL